MTIKEMVTQAKILYPNSKNLRKQWIRKTKMLVESNNHVLYGAVPKWGESRANI